MKLNISHAAFGQHSNHPEDRKVLHRLDLSRVKGPKPSNLQGKLGPKCSNCGGWGYTINFLTGKPLFCKKCNKTGVSSG